MSKDFKSTLKLPKTAFPMRANLAKREPGFLKFWEKIDIYGQLKKKNAGNPPFILHDGPPYANGNIHIGHAFNKILKDFIPRYKWMRGYFAPYVPGWDTHGLPIELKVLKSKDIDRDSVDPVELRTKCAECALHYRDIQREEFKRLGVIGDWNNPYVTLNPEYEAAQLGAFADMVEKGLIYKGQKPVYWCINCQTALAAAEIEYGDETSPSIFVAYSLPDVGDKDERLRGRDVNVIVWTTTPWTMPASMAIAIGPGYDYSFVTCGDKVYLLAKDLIESVEQTTGLKFDETICTFKGRELEGMVAKHPFYSERDIPVVLAGYVMLDAGTGCVHTAPGHGVEDYETGVRYGIPIYNPVDSKGYFYEDTPIVGGLSIDDGAEKCLQLMRENGTLLAKVKITHSYPHCWRCKDPVIFRSTDQWFVNVAKYRDEALRTIDEVNWVPSWGKSRIYNMVKDRSDWCISRQRVWGVPIPAFYCKECGKLILTADRIKCVQKIVSQKGSNVWWKMSPEELLGNLAVCPHCGSKDLRKETDIMDVWFDSGVSHLSVLEARKDLNWPAELYLEGSDQHRGWFQTSLLTSVATREAAPYKSVLTHGFIVDGKGKKMSKSIGNVVAPQKIIDKYGADILRLWVASTDYRNDIRISQTIIKTLTEEYRRIRNTARFLLGNLADFNPEKDCLNYEQMEEMDRWAISRLNRVIDKVTEGYENYEFHVPTVTIHQFCVNDLSSFYLDASKDRLYAEAGDSIGRRSCQSAMWTILTTITRLLAPVLSFTAEEIWQNIREIDNNQPESIFLTQWPSYNSANVDEDLEKSWAEILKVRGAVSRALESARTSGVIGHPLEARVIVKRSSENEDVSKRLSSDMWATIAIVSSFEWLNETSVEADFKRDEETELEVSIDRATGKKCPRCWKYSTEYDEDGLCPRCKSVLMKQL